MEKKSDFTLFNRITDIYILFIIVLFPLIVDRTGFFKILECKYKVFIGISGLYFLIIIFLFLFNLFFKKINFFKIKKISIIQWTAIAFLFVNILSCFLSPYFNNYNLFVGVGRGEGLITSSFYILAFLFVSYFGKFDKKHILYFSLSSILISFIAILQFVGFNPFNIYQDGIGTHNVSFMSTIGNVDFISAIYTIFLSISFTSYIFDKYISKYEKLIHLLSVFMGSYIFLIIDVSSGKLAFGSIIIILLPFIFQDNKRLSNFLDLVSVILLGVCLNVFMNIEYHYDIGKLGFYFNFNYIVLLFLIIIIALIFISRLLNNNNYNITNKKYFYKFYSLLFLLGIIGIVSLYFIPFKSGFLYEIHELLHFNFDDDFGTYRIFLWKRTLPLIKDYPLLGSGPDTFALRFMPLYYEDIAAIGPLSINDTAANIYLTMIINIGLIGFINYIALLFIQCYNGIRKINSNSYILLISFICYSIQAFFNLSVVIVSPLFWVLMAVHYLSIYDTNKEE